MLLTTPFHSRVEAMCDVNDWGNWMGYTTPNAYFDVELEYFAIRSTTGVFDLSPMNKYRITGPDAEAYLNRMVTRDVSKIRVNRVGYAVWCNDAGEVMDDGTIFRLGKDDFRLAPTNVPMNGLSGANSDLTYHQQRDRDSRRLRYRDQRLARFFHCLALKTSIS